MIGFYCPNSGRISFLRTSESNGQTYQNYSGNLSEQVRGKLHWIGGTFSEDLTLSNIGEYRLFGAR